MIDKELLIEKVVYHKTFGVGKIKTIEFRENGRAYITVAFADSQFPVCDFVFPGAFEKGFLATNDDYINKMIQKSDSAKKTDKDEKIKNLQPEKCPLLPSVEYFTYFEDKASLEELCKKYIKIDYTLPPEWKKVNRLTLYKKCGTVARDIFVFYSEKFFWNRNKRFDFGWQRLMFAEKATREGYSVWFLANNNQNNRRGGIWENKIKEDTIEEYWEEPDSGFYKEKAPRVTFVKNRFEQYEFWGVCVPIKAERISLRDGTEKWRRIYKRIDNIYPR